MIVTHFANMDMTGEIELPEEIEAERRFWEEVAEENQKCREYYVRSEDGKEFKLKNRKKALYLARRIGAKEIYMYDPYQDGWFMYDHELKCFVYQ